MFYRFERSDDFVLVKFILRHMDWNLYFLYGRKHPSWRIQLIAKWKWQILTVQKDALWMHCNVSPGWTAVNDVLCRPKYFSMYSQSAGDEKPGTGFITAVWRDPRLFVVVRIPFDHDPETAWNMSIDFEKPLPWRSAMLASSGVAGLFSAARTHGLLVQPTTISRWPTDVVGWK